MGGGGGTRARLLLLIEGGGGGAARESAESRAAFVRLEESLIRLLTCWIPVEGDRIPLLVPKDAGEAGLLLFTGLEMPLWVGAFAPRGVRLLELVGVPIPAP